MRIECIDDAAGLENLASEWESLQRSAGNGSFFLGWPWIRCWWRAYGGGKRLQLLTVRGGDGALRGLLPLYVGRARSFRVLPVRALRFVGHGENTAADHMDLIAARSHEDEVVGLVSDWLVEHSDRWDLLRLAALPADSLITTRVLPRLAARRFPANDPIVTGACPYMTLPEGADAFWASMSHKLRKNVRRYRRLVERDFEVEVRTCRRREDLPGMMGDLQRLHAERKTQQGIEAKFTEARYRAFHEELATLLLDRGGLKLVFLVLNGRPAAVLYGFVFGGVLFEYQTGFDPEFAPYSVGNVLDGYVLEGAVTEGIREADFLRGLEPYKLHWTKSIREETGFSVESRTPRGVAHGVLRRVRRELRRAVPPSPSSPGDA
jgi:CelD/BcsL family acetyltransferase involved in cellulose biosynthesis